MPVCRLLSQRGIAKNDSKELGRARQKAKVSCVMIYRFIGIMIVWFAIWLAVWRVFYGPMAERRVNYVDRFLWTCVYFLLVSVVTVLLFKDVLAPFAGELTADPFVVLAVTFALQIVLYRLAVRHLRRPGKLIESNPREMFLRLDYRYLVSKSFEVLFQQIMIVLLVVTAWRQTGNLVGTMVIFAGVFALAHLPLLKLYGEQAGFFAKIYLAAALVSAVLFPVFILKVNLGFVYTYAMHSMFFTVLALWFWWEHTVVHAD
jgi:hypothetical protein